MFALSRTFAPTWNTISDDLAGESDTSGTHCIGYSRGRILWLSNYGYGTTRLVACFLLATVVFAAIYLIPTPVPPWAPDWWPTWECEQLVQNLEVQDNDCKYQWEPTWTRALYFSVVTMTTLGLGDMYAPPQSVLGHWLLITHVIIGYVLLGALITRFAILFQSVEG